MTKPNFELSPVVLGEKIKNRAGDRQHYPRCCSQAAGIARTTLVSIEKGQRPARLDEIQALSRFYGVSANSLLRQEAVHVDLVPRFRSTPGYRRRGH